MMKFVPKKPEEIVNVILNGQKCKEFFILKIRFYHMNHYETLGINPSATQAEIKAAYVKLSKKLHPDVNRKDPKSHDKFVAVNNAYSVLRKPNTRRQYDIESGIVYRSMPRVHQHDTRSDQNFHRYNKSYQGHGPFNNPNSLFYKLHRNYQFRIRVYLLFRVVPMGVLLIFGILQWIEDIQKAQYRKKNVKVNHDK